LLYNVLKTFDPVIDKIEQGFAAISAVVNTLMDTVLSLVTGAKSLTEAFSGLGSSMSEAAKDAIEFTKAQQDLDDLLVKSTVNQAKYNRQVNELILQSKDRTKTEAERIALIDQALAIENTAFTERKKIADEELKIAQNAIISGKNLTAEQKKQLREKGAEYAISLKDTKRVTDDEVKALAAAQAKQEDLLNQSISLREKALNRRYALEDAAIDKEKSDSEKRAAAKKKEEDDKKAADEKAWNEKLKTLKAQSDAEKTEAQLNADGIAQIAAEDLANKTKADVEKDRLSQNENDRASFAAQQRVSNYEADKAIDEQTVANKQAMFSAILNFSAMLSEALGRNTAAGKAIAVAGAFIDTYSAVTATLKAAAKTPAGGIPGYAIAQAIAVGAAGLINVKRIISVQVPGQGGGAGGASIPNLASPLAPQNTNTRLDSSSIQGVGNAASGGVNRSFVLDADIKSNQERQARIARAARLG